MPEFTVKEVRLPELRLPEIKRDEIVRSLSGVHLPEVDLAKARRASIKIPAVSLSSADVGRMLAVGATIARLVRPAPSRSSWLADAIRRRTRTPIARIVQPRRRRSRWPIALGVVAVLALGAWALLRRPGVRERVDAAARDARARFDEMRRGNDDTAIELHEPVALSATGIGAGEIEGVSASTGDPDTSGTPVFEETGSPA